MTAELAAIDPASKSLTELGAPAVERAGPAAVVTAIHNASVSLVNPDGYDISFWQGSTPNLAGKEFCIARATYGNLIDSRYVMHHQHIRQQGVIDGAYAFGRSELYATVASQVSAFLAIAPYALLYALDLEDDGNLVGMNDAEAARFISGMHQAGKRVGLYHSESGFPTLGQDFDWVANWSRQPARRWDFWQDGGTTLDHDWFNGELAQLREFAGLEPPDTGTGGDIVDPKTAAPIAVADYRAGGSLYADLASTQVLSSPWPGGTNVGVYARDRRKDGMLMNALRVSIGGVLRVGWTGEDHASHFRLPGQTQKTVTVTGVGLTVTTK